MRLVQFGTTPTDRIQNKTIRGISLTTKMVHATLNTAFVAGDLDYSQIILKVTLMRGGHAFIVCQDNVRNLAASTNYFNPIFLTAKSFLNGLVQTVAHGVGAFEQAISQVDIDFGCPINVHGGDSLIAEIQCPLAAIVAANVNSVTSQMQMDWIAAVGHEFATPFIKGYNLQAAEQNQNISMGDNIVDIVMLNYDKTDHLSANATLVSATLKNNKYQPTFTYDQMVGRRQKSFVTSAEALLRLQSWCLYDNDQQDLDGCELQLQLVPGNIAAGQNVIMYRGYHFTPGAFEKGHKDHKANMQRKVGKVYGHEAVEKHLGATSGRG